MNKKYRPNVAGIIMDENYPETKNVWLGHRSDMRNVWQFPQGGIDANETYEQAFLREMEEEIGTSNVEIIDMCPTWLKYDFPYNKTGRYVGQQQKYFLAKLKNNNDINIKTAHPEFEEYKFVPIKDLFKHVSNFKIPIYREAFKYFEEQGHL